MRQLVYQFSKFSTVGIIGTIMHYGVMAVAIEGFQSHPVAASSAGFLISAVVSYWLNHRITFKSAVSHRRALPRFLAVGTFGLGINSILVAAMIGPAHWHWLPSQMVATACVLCWNFAANRMWTFAADFPANSDDSR